MTRRYQRVVTAARGTSPTRPGRRSPPDDRTSAVGSDRTGTISRWPGNHASRSSPTHLHLMLGAGERRPATDSPAQQLGPVLGTMPAPDPGRLQPTGV